MLLPSAIENKFLHINSITHEGKVVVVGTRQDGSLCYTVKQDGFEDSYLDTPAEKRTGWEDWQPLEFPDETNDESAVEKETNELTYENDSSQFILRSRYQTRNESAVAPVQLISALGHIYVFRQSKSSTLLVDRFVLDGMTNTLNRKLEVRFKRSRQKYTPTKSMARNSTGLANVDSLDFRDANGNFFYEPTTELCLIRNLQNGWFSAVLVPTVENDVQRWQIFAYNTETRMVELTTLRASNEGLFEVRDYTVFEESNGKLIPNSIPGIIRRSLEINDVTITNGLAAARYDLQQEQETQAGDRQLIRTATRLMVAIPTDRGTAAFSFAIAGDGTLAQISETPETTVLRSQQREILLPLNTLDEIKTLGDETPPPQGTISGLQRGTDSEDAEDLVKVETDDLGDLKNGDVVKVTATRSYDGLYRVTKLTHDTFAIELPEADGLGHWEKQEEVAGGLTFDGLISAYKITDEGLLEVTCRNHGLEDGDEVQIVGGEDYNNTYSVRKVDDTHFVIERKWAAAEAEGIDLMSEKRQGIVFDGVNDYIEIPHASELSLDVLTVEAWVNPDEAQAGWSNIIGKLSFGGDQYNYWLCLVSDEASSELKFQLRMGTTSGGSIAIGSTSSLAPNGWSHIAAAWDGAKLSLYLNGELDSSQGVNLGADMHIAKNLGPLLIGGEQFNRDFAGKIADVRIWNLARSAQAIKNSMHLQLIGKEVGLVGYWRLGAIAEGKVIDFSINGNDGRVHGDPYASAVTRYRRLDTGELACKYANAELFAVRERATYEESFEFKVNPAEPVNPAYLENADGQIFTFSYWGKAGRSVEEVTSIDGVQNKFEDLRNGWYRASGSVTIPDGVSMLRSFEIGNIQGAWESLEIRKHRIRLLSDTIREAKYIDSVTLTTLADQQAGLGEKLNQIGAAEQEEAALLLQRQDINSQLAFLNLSKEAQAEAIRIKTDEFAQQKTVVDELTPQVNYLKLELDRMELRITIYEGENFTGKSVSYGIGSYLGTADGFLPGYNVGSMRIPTGLRVVLLDREVGAVENRHRAQTMTLTSDCESLKDYMWILRSDIYSRDFSSRISIETIDGNFVKRWFQEMFDEKSGKLAPAQVRLKELGHALDLLTSQLKKGNELSQQLQDVNARLIQVQTRLNAINKDFLDGILATRQTPQQLPRINDDNLPLMVRGALLGFVQPASRLNAIETCEGNVQLSYFDTRGRMRQTNYDATADSQNDSFEQWIPDGQRACLDFANGNSVLKLNHPPLLSADWSIEAWFYHPLPDAGEWNSLVCSPSGDAYIAVRNRKQLGVRLGDDFYACGFDMESLLLGWHHLTAVGRGDTTLFYMDGKRAGDNHDIKASALADARSNAEKNRSDDSARQKVEDLNKASLKVSGEVHAIGNNPVSIARSGSNDGIVVGASLSNAITPFVYGEQFGKVAEVRIWGVALSEEEIAVNSRTVLSGNEPGLLAYYPLSEAAGVEIMDHTRNQAKAGTASGNWIGCTAPIGRLENTVVKFDGVNDLIEVPHAPQLDLEFFTFEAWVNPNAGQPTKSAILCKSDCQKLYLTPEFCLSVRCYWPSSSSAHQTGSIVLSPGVWSHVCATFDEKHMLALYVDGKLDTCSGPFDHGIWRTDTGPLLIGNGRSMSSFAGRIAEVRIWNRARTQAEIQASMYNRLAVNEPGLVAYYPLNEFQFSGAARNVLDMVRRNHGTVTEALLVEDSALPIGADALISNEYSTVIMDPLTKRKAAMMRRFIAYPTSRGVELLPGKRIELLELKWIGNGQFAPTLLGYIEGAPPVPSENLTLEDDYNGATSVELVASEDVEFSWNRSTDRSWGGVVDAFVGGGGEMSILTAPMGMGTSITTSTKAGAKADLETSVQDQHESNVSASSSLSLTDKLELRGTPEETAKFPHLGKRFIPKNVGYALVVSALADIFITRLARSGKMVGYQVQPVEGIPPDVNTITFMINPAYTMNGSLDGMTGSSATSDRFFRHIPEMRAQHGSLYPASYYRLQEAYDLKRQIEAEDKRREAYFTSSKVGFTEAGLDRNLEIGEAPVPISLQREEAKPDTQQTADEQKKAQDEKAEQFQQESAVAAEATGSTARAKQAEIQQQIADQDQQVHASEAFEDWQKKMEKLQTRAGKHNIVNTYVWDGDGGMRIEAQSFAATVEHTIGGSLDLAAALGIASEFELGVSFELTVQKNFSMTLSGSKTEARSKGFELNVDLGGLEFKGITDYKDNPILPGEKVDRYRFMTFFLEGSTQHFHDFFNYVVDPEWLVSNDEEARALRQTQAGKPNKTWRVLHRVTYVERPALMGFGRDVRKLRAAAEKSENELLLEKISTLDKKVNTLTDLLNRLLS